MIYTQESDFEIVQSRRYGPHLVRKNRIEPHFVFEAGDFQWTAADIEFYFKLWFYHWQLFGVAGILGEPLPASFVHWVRSKCSGYERNSPAGAE
jgi:hypothetical protein